MDPPQTPDQGAGAPQPPAQGAGVVVVVDAANGGRRLDKTLRQLCSQVPLGALMRLLRRGAVRLNGQRVAGDARLRPGDRIELPARLQEGAPSAPAHGPRLPRLRLPCLYQDDDLLVLDKPAGLACHPGTAQRQPSLIEQVQASLGPATVGHRAGLAQRLDAAVSGVLVVGKHAAALRALSAAVENGSCRKVYWALVRGIVRPLCGTIDVPLRVDDQPNGGLPRTLPDPQHGKPARTDYRVLSHQGDHSLCEVRLHTGRTHQIRAHMRHLGHALLGDPRYGDAGLNRYLQETYGLAQVALHAASVWLPHPADGRMRLFCAPLPPAMRRLLSPAPAAAQG